MKKIGKWYLPDNEMHFVEQLKEKGSKGYQVVNRITMLDAYNMLPNYKNKLAIDVGANIGFWTKDFCKKFDNVIAYEPVPINLECLRSNCTESNLTIIDKALSHKEGKTTIWGLQHFESGSFTMDSSLIANGVPLEISTVMLDSEANKWTEDQRKNCFIKIDVQGHEKAVLKGGTKFIKEYGPAICIEIRANKETRGPWIKWFRKRNYILKTQYKKEHLFIPATQNNIRR